MNIDNTYSFVVFLLAILGSFFVGIFFAEETAAPVTTEFEFPSRVINQGYMDCQSFGGVALFNVDRQDRFIVEVTCNTGLVNTYQYQL